MIKVLGIKRVLTLAILFGINVALAAMLYLVITPAQESTDKELRSTRAAVQGKRAEVSRMQTEYQQIQQEKNLFGDLENSGFFGSQDRVEARNIMESIQSTSHVLSAKYNINAVEAKENSAAALSDHIILQSPVTVQIDALDDVDVYSFLYWIENGFPGQALITDITLERKQDIDENVLKQIGNGSPAVLMSANVNFAWNTFVPRDKSPVPSGQASAPK
ncbi:MAG: hypothetical protein JWO78_365 [Micavibrio sp.]|nr:hypothetical protein [Micavibrio sp.]